MLDSSLGTIAFVVLAVLVVALAVAGMLLGLIACSPAKRAQKASTAGSTLPNSNAPK